MRIELSNCAIDRRPAFPLRGKLAFTLVEIALSLAIVGFALVAIIGVLPAGMRVQKDNREETIINQDGLYLLEAIRSGARGIDDLTNYVETVIITNTVIQNNRIVRRSVAAWTNDFRAPLNRRLTNGGHIVSLLTTPKLQLLSNGRYSSNNVAAYVRAITGVASEKSVNNPNVRDFAFRYLLRSEMVPFTQPVVGPSEVLRSVDLGNNLHDLRLSLSWPLFQRGAAWEVGSNRKVFRALVAGEIDPATRLIEPAEYSSRY